VHSRRALLSAQPDAAPARAREPRRAVRHGHRPARPRPPIPRTLAEAIHGPVIGPHSPTFAEAAHVYNERFDNVLPQAIARPLSVEDVQGAVRWAVAHDVRLAARSGGHSYAGYSTLSGAVVLDLRLMRSIRVDRIVGTATIGTGAQLIDIYAALAAHGATLPAGSCPSVGIAGHALGGGMGLAGRAFGLATARSTASLRTPLRSCTATPCAASST